MSYSVTCSNIIGWNHCWTSEEDIRASSTQKHIYFQIWQIITQTCLSWASQYFHSFVLLSFHNNTSQQCTLFFKYDEPAANFEMRKYSGRRCSGRLRKIIVLSWSAPSRRARLTLPVVRGLKNPHFVHSSLLGKALYSLCREFLINIDRFSANVSLRQEHWLRPLLFLRQIIFIYKAMAQRRSFFVSAFQGLRLFTVAHCKLC